MAHLQPRFAAAQSGLDAPKPSAALQQSWSVKDGFNTARMAPLESDAPLDLRELKYRQLMEQAPGEDANAGAALPHSLEKERSFLDFDALHNDKGSGYPRLVTSAAQPGMHWPPSSDLTISDVGGGAARYARAAAGRDVFSSLASPPPPSMNQQAYGGPASPALWAPTTPFVGHPAMPLRYSPNTPAVATGHSAAPNSVASWGAIAKPAGTNVSKAHNANMASPFAAYARSAQPANNSHSFNPNATIVGASNGAPQADGTQWSPGHLKLYTLARQLSQEFKTAVDTLGDAPPAPTTPMVPAALLDLDSSSTSNNKALADAAAQRLLHCDTPDSQGSWSSSPSPARSQASSTANAALEHQMARFEAMLLSASHLPAELSTAPAGGQRSVQQAQNDSGYETFSRKVSVASQYSQRSGVAPSCSGQVDSFADSAAAHYGTAHCVPWNHAAVSTSSGSSWRSSGQISDSSEELLLRANSQAERLLQPSMGTWAAPHTAPTSAAPLPAAYRPAQMMAEPAGVSAPVYATAPQLGAQYASQHAPQQAVRVVAGLNNQQAEAASHRAASLPFSGATQPPSAANLPTPFLTATPRTQQSRAKGQVPIGSKAAGLTVDLPPAASLASCQFQPDTPQPAHPPAAAAAQACSAVARANSWPAAAPPSHMLSMSPDLPVNMQRQHWQLKDYRVQHQLYKVREGRRPLLAGAGVCLMDPPGL